MTDYLLLLIGTVLVNNFVLVKFLGLCPFMGVSSKLASAIGMSMATTFVLTLASILSYLTNEFILQPFELTYLRTMSFILVIAVENLFHSNFLIVPFFCECIYRRRLKHKAQLLKRLPLDLRK